MYNRFEPCITPFITDLYDVKLRCAYCNSPINNYQGRYLIIKDTHFNWHKVCFACAIATAETLQSQIKKVANKCKLCQGDGFFYIDNMYYNDDPNSDKPEKKQCSNCEGLGWILK